MDYTSLTALPFARLFHLEARDVAMSLLVESSTTARTERAPVRLADGREGYTATASVFRLDGAAHVRVSITAIEDVRPNIGDDAKLKLLRVLNRSGARGA
jgi:tryptophanase